MTQVFISYSRKDISFINMLVADLKNAGMEVWHDVSHIARGARCKFFAGGYSITLLLNSF